MTKARGTERHAAKRHAAKRHAPERRETERPLTRLELLGIDWRQPEAAAIASRPIGEECESVTPDHGYTPLDRPAVEGANTLE